MKREPVRVFPEIEEYRELLEDRHLRAKNHYVVLILFVAAALSTVYMALAGYPVREILPIGSAYVVLILMNAACTAYGDENIRFNQLNKYVTTIGVFGIAVVMIFTFQSPSMLSLLFIAYAISAFYQDRKAMLIANILLPVAFVTLMTNYRAFFAVVNPTPENDAGLFFFVIVFISLLTISQYIMIKQKGFFYQQIAISKETEFRNIDFMIDAAERATGRKPDVQGYFDAVGAFGKALADKLGVEDSLADKLDILRLIEAGTPPTRIAAAHPGTTPERIEALRNLTFGGHGKLRKVAIKLSRLRSVDVHRREIFSETQFKTFNHPSDPLEIKIIAFAVFYTAMKKGTAGMRPLSEKEIYDAIVGTDYYFYNDPQVMRIYRENSAVFDAIVKDALETGATK